MSFRNKYLINNSFFKNFSFLLFEDIQDFGKKCFLLGVFFLPTVLVFSALFFLISLIIAFWNSRDFLIKDSWNISILISLGIILFSTIGTYFINTPPQVEELNLYTIWIQIFNWIPILLSFIGFQIYLKDQKDKLLFAKFLILGTIPVIFSCFYQLLFDSGKDFNFLNGLIIWFQKPLKETNGISGLFSNKNYTGTWLSVSLPFSFALISEKNNKKAISKLFLKFISALITYFIFLTNSRNAFLTMLLTILFFYGLKKFIICILILLIFFFGIKFFLETFNLFSNDANNLLSQGEIFKRLYTQPQYKNFLRYRIWDSSVKFIMQRPLLGWGAGTFGIIYKFLPNILNPPSAQHTHNLPLELAFNFGIPFSLFLTFIFSKLFFESCIKFYKDVQIKQYSYIDKAWIASTGVIIFINMTDVTLYDGKIGLLSGILFAGLRTSLKIKN